MRLFNLQFLIDNIHYVVSIVLKSTMAVGAMLCFIWGHYLLAVGTVIIIAIALMPVLLSRRFKLDIPPEFDLLTIIFIYTTLYLGSVQGFYHKYWWWDGMLHTASGFILGIVGFLMVFVLNQRREVGIGMKPHFVALFAFTFSITLGVLWEIFEFAVDSAFDMNMQETGLVDTMWDLIVDTLGALAVAIMGWGYLKKSGGDSFIERWINNFIERNPDYFKQGEN